MWKCLFCGSEDGMPYKDRNLNGMLCLAPNCGRFNELVEEEGAGAFSGEAGMGINM